MKILVGGPARQSEGIFVEHLKGIEWQEIPDGVEIHKYYIINDCDELKKYLREDEYEVINSGEKYEKNELTHIWTGDNLSKMCILRNAMLKKCIIGGYDAVLFVDTDVVMHPDTIKHLVSADKDIVAEIFWTKGEDGGYWPNCWEYDQCSSVNGDRWLRPGIYRVGGTGACMLVRRSVIEHKVSYSPLYNIRYAMRGEDRWFCIRAVCAGYELYVDTHAPATHLYRESEYKKYMEVTYGGH